LRLISLHTTKGQQFNFFAIALIDKCVDRPRKISSCSCNVNARFERLGFIGLMPPYFCKKPKTEPACLFICLPTSLSDFPALHKDHWASFWYPVKYLFDTSDIICNPLNFDCNKLGIAMVHQVCSSVFRQGETKSVKCTFIREKTKNHLVEQLCEIREISCSSYYDHESKSLRMREETGQRLVPIVEEVFKINRQAYGYYRVSNDVKKHDKNCWKPV
jgi:hypothetical protein